MALPTQTYTIVNSGAQWTGGLEFLDRYNVNCPTNSFIYDFKFDRYYQWETDMILTLKCVQYANVQYGTSETLQSAYSDKGGLLIFLDRHWPTCSNGKVMTGWKGLLNNGQIAIQYTCWSANYVPRSTYSFFLGLGSLVTPETWYDLGVQTGCGCCSYLGNQNTGTTRNGWNTMACLQNIGPAQNTGDCPTGLAAWGMIYNGANWWQLKFKYKCATLSTSLSSVPAGTYTTVDSSPKESNGGLEYLDRQDANCPTNSFISGFKFVLVSGTTNVYVSLNCVSYPGVTYETGSVETRQSDWFDKGDAIAYFGNTFPTCSEGKAMTGWKGVRNWLIGSTNLMSIQYTCYGATFPMPTAAPTTTPTAAPTMTPTMTPTAATTPTQENPNQYIESITSDGPKRFVCPRPANRTKMTFMACTLAE